MLKLRFSILKVLCKFNLHPRKIYSHSFKNLYSVYEVHICKTCLKQLIKKKQYMILICSIQIVIPLWLIAYELKKLNEKK